VHNGNKALFWKSSWLNGCAPAVIFPTLYNHSRRKNRTMPNALAINNWIQDLMYDLSPEMFADYPQLWLLVDGTTFSANDQAEDTIVWTRTANGRYSAKSAYNMQFDGSSESSFPAVIWQTWAPSRCKVFIWLMLQRRIWTADRLLLR
jgi:hypothetical protein